jgi:predicted molibdopterin-dependent oxidoreductase YjgC
VPELHRIRKILSQEGLFVVVQDAFLTETARRHHLFDVAVAESKTEE